MENSRLAFFKLLFILCLEINKLIYKFYIVKFIIKVASLLFLYPIKGKKILFEQFTGLARLVRIKRELKRIVW